ncbi:hypothetical protein GOB29_28665 [Sinorhizobium meliloti]|nr:hypothetical protein [Sinorhizobium meliloti]
MFALDLAKMLIQPTLSDLPDEAAKHAKMLVASTLASAALGTNLESAGIIRDLAYERGGAPRSTVWFSSRDRLPAMDAARVNAVMSDAAASDDSDLRSIMHCGTPLTAVALAVAEMTGSSGAEVVAAIVLGYEAAGRIHDALPRYRKLGFHGTSLTIFCAATAAGRLLKLDVEKMTHALALAATSTGGLSKAADTSVAREYQAGQAVMNGVQAALAAGRGFTAEPRIFEMPGGFFSSYGGEAGEASAEAALAGFGESWDILTDMAVKLVPGGHPHHALAEAAGNAVKAGDVSVEEIAAIQVSRPGLTKLGGPLHPEDLVGMAHSPAYFLAAGAADRNFTWAHASSEKISDPAIHRLIDKIVVGPEPTQDVDRYRQGATVTVTTMDGRSFTSSVFCPKGSGILGLEWSDIDEKYRTLMPYGGVAQSEIDSGLEIIHELEAVPTMAPLVRTVRT